MIKTISRHTSEGKLTVVVQCYPRKFATYEKKILTTKQVLDMLKEKENIKKVITKPGHQVANFVSSKTRLVGEWVFELEEPVVEEPVVEEPQKKKKSIRNRISKLAKNEQ